jgi:outer membrane beta-barrel protein
MMSRYVHTALNLTAAIALLFAIPAHAQSDKKPAAKAGVKADGSGKPDEKLDVSDLEKKYWSAKDTEFNVVQNRLFSKAGRYALTLSGGQYINDPWSTGLTGAASLNYFFSERYGAELAYSMTNSVDNKATENVKSQGGAPNHNKMKGFYGVAFNWVPFYAKMSVLNSSIVYFDMSFSPGVGLVQYDQQLFEGNVSKTAPALTFDITQHYFLSKWMAIRFDFKNRFYNHDITEYRTPGGAGIRTTTTELNYTSLMMLGATFYF